MSWKRDRNKVLAVQPNREYEYHITEDHLNTVNRAVAIARTVLHNATAKSDWENDIQVQISRLFTEAWTCERHESENTEREAWELVEEGFLSVCVTGGGSE